MKKNKKEIEEKKLRLFVTWHTVANLDMALVKGGEWDTIMDTMCYDDSPEIRSIGCGTWTCGC